MTERRREREMMKLAERQRRWRPGDDEFDVGYRGNRFGVFGFWVLWIAIVRGVRRLRRQKP